MTEASLHVTIELHMVLSCSQQSWGAPGASRPVFCTMGAPGTSCPVFYTMGAPGASCPVFYMIHYAMSVHLQASDSVVRQQLARVMAPIVPMTPLPSEEDRNDRLVTTHLGESGAPAP